MHAARARRTAPHPHPRPPPSPPLATPVLRIEDAPGVRAPRHPARYGPSSGHLDAAANGRLENPLRFRPSRARTRRARAP
ncbi:hypothetical protein C7S17_0914 [Burkholderia thailandensis]|nr:hypothetical protein [Burkholderia thailandensis]